MEHRHVSVTGLAEPEEVPALFVTDGMLPMLGAQPMLGRVFTQKDDTPGTPETVVLTAGYWRRSWRRPRRDRPDASSLDGQPREIIGVLPDASGSSTANASLVVPYPVRSQQDVPRPIQLPGGRRG